MADADQCRAWATSSYEGVPAATSWMVAGRALLAIDGRRLGYD